MTRSRLRLTLAVCLFLAWIGYLAFLVVRTRDPVILARPQFLETDVVIVAALNGLAVLHAYFRIFTGTHPLASIDIQARLPEKIGILVLTLLILGGGIFPQPGVSSRYDAARELTRLRSQENSAPAPAHVQLPRPEPAHLTSAGTH